MEDLRLVCCSADGEGEVVGGIMWWHGMAKMRIRVINDVKENEDIEKDSLKASPSRHRTTAVRLIEEAMNNIKTKLIEEIIVGGNHCCSVPIPLAESR